MIIPVGFGQITYLYDGASTPNGAANTIGFANEAGLTLPAIADAFQDFWNTHLGPHLDNGAAGNIIRVKLGPVETGPQADFARIFGGDNPGASVTPNTAMLIRKQTALGGRAGRGRMFVPGLQENEVDEQGVIGSAQLAAIQANLDLWVANAVVAGLPLMLFHNELEPYATPTPIQSLQVDSRVATQRRRLRR